MSNYPERYRRQNRIISETAIDVIGTTAKSYAINGQDIEIWVTQGTVWIDAVNVATQATGLKCSVNSVIELNVKGSISLISDSTTAKAQIIVFE